MILLPSAASQGYVPHGRGINDGKDGYCGFRDGDVSSPAIFLRLMSDHKLECFDDVVLVTMYMVNVKDLKKITALVESCKDLRGFIDLIPTCVARSVPAGRVTAVLKEVGFGSFGTGFTLDTKSERLRDLKKISSRIVLFDRESDVKSVWKMNRRFYDGSRKITSTEWVFQINEEGKKPRYIWLQDVLNHDPVIVKSFSRKPPDLPRA